MNPHSIVVRNRNGAGAFFSLCGLDSGLEDADDIRHDREPCSQSRADQDIVETSVRVRTIRGIFVCGSWRLLVSTQTSQSRTKLGHLRGSRNTCDLTKHPEMERKFRHLNKEPKHTARFQSLHAPDISKTQNSSKIETRVNLNFKPESINGF